MSEGKASAHRAKHSHAQSWFVGRIGRFLADRGRILIGWDEILEGTADGRRLPPQSVIMSWRVRRGLIGRHAWCFGSSLELRALLAAAASTA